MFRKIAKFDILGKKFQIRASGASDTHNTALGGCLTAIWWISATIIAVVILRNYQDTSRPVVSVNKLRLRSPPALNLTENNVGFLLFSTTYAKRMTFEETRRFITIESGFISTKNTQNEKNQQIGFFDQLTKTAIKSGIDPSTSGYLNW